MSTLDDRAVALQRMRQGWVPTHSPAARAHLDNYYESIKGVPVDPFRFVGEASGLDHRDIHSVINDRSLGERFFEIHADFLHPHDSRYIDPFFGEFVGQRAIREWLIPTLSGSGAVSFDATYPAEFLDDGEGGTSIDEWQLSAYDGNDWVPVTDGISIRRYRDGWITDAIDHFDTTPVRMGASQVAEGADPLVLPDPPTVLRDSDPAWSVPMERTETAQAWLDARSTGAHLPELSNDDLFCLLFDQRVSMDFHLVGDLMHPTDSVYLDPIFGRIEGREPIREWLVDIMGKTGTVDFEPLSPALLDGDVCFQEFRQVAVLPSGERVPMVQGASVRRLRDGFVVHAADYFDTAHLMRTEVIEASTAAGASITAADIVRYRPELAGSVEMPSD